MAKIFKKIYIAIFIAILVTPCAAFSVSGSSAELPVLVEDSGLNTDFSGEAEDAFESNMPLKDEMITLNSLIKSKVFKSESANVITGSGGQLFYSETTDDYINASQMSAREIFSSAKTLALISEYCQSQGAGFTFAAVSNKNSVLGEYMPYNFVQGSGGNLENLSGALSDMGVNQAEIYGALTNAENRDSLYYKTDTHWNSYGAYIGFSQIISSLGAAMPQELANLTEADFETANGRSTDLSSLLFTALDLQESSLQLKNSEFLTDKIKITIRGADTTDTVKLLAQIDDKDEDFSQIKTTCAASGANGSLLMLRDSFCRAMLPYFAYTYKEALFLKSAELNAYIYDLAEYDDFVYEIVERNLENIIESRQLIPAPERELGEVSLENQNGGTITANTDYSDYVMISGEIDAGYISDDSCIYIRLTDSQTNESRCYEAFPAQSDGGVLQYYMTLPAAEQAQYYAELIVDSAVVATAEISF
ncbi:MAG: hypothetical protein LUH82_00325 [Clostridiales bacterium]|nr:hypothetical protein [Clostridiales bacterium]